MTGRGDPFCAHGVPVTHACTVCWKKNQVAKDLRALATRIEAGTWTRVEIERGVGRGGAMVIVYLKGERAR